MPTPLLLETIRIEEGVPCNLPYHQARFDQSRKILFQDATLINLDALINAPKIGIYRCRILYHTQTHSIEYIPYTAKIITKLKVIPSSLTYTHKYAARIMFNELLLAHPEVDDVIIEKDGYLSDTTIANIALYDGKVWWTPKVPLLKGTMRQKLIDEGFLHTCHIRKKDLKHYTKIALLNAMIGFKILDNTLLNQLTKDTL